MTSYLYLIFDIIAGTAFGGIIRVPNDEVARRSFHDALKNQDSPLAQHQADYELRKLGELDENNGIITPYLHPTAIASGKDWLDANQGA